MNTKLILLKLPRRYYSLQNLLRCVGAGGTFEYLFGDLYAGRPYGSELLGDEVVVGKLIETGRPIMLKVRVVLITVSTSEDEVRDMFAVAEEVDVDIELDVSEEVDVGEDFEVA